MNASLPQNQFFLALGILFAVHTVVSFGAYCWLTTTTVQKSPENAPVEVTTPAQAQKGERVFTANKVVTVSRTIPRPVPCYIIAGYAGLVVAVILWLVRQGRATDLT